MKAAGIKVKSLHTGLAERLDVEPPSLAPVKRVQVKEVVIVIAAIIAANSLISQIANVGIDTLGDELAAASFGWFIVAFLIRMVSYTTAYLGMRALISQTLPFLPTTLLQSAKSFVGLVVPSMVGRVGMDIRFLQKAWRSISHSEHTGPGHQPDRFRGRGRSSAAVGPGPSGKRSRLTVSPTSMQEG